MQEENSGISLRDIFKVIFTQKWLALIIAVVITVGGTLAIQFGYNNGQKYYSSQFSLVLPGDGNDESRYTYPDGTPFQYADMVAKKALNAVKESSENFSGIDVDYIVKQGAISVSRNVGEKDGVITYTLSARANCFPDYNTAREFIIALANVPVKYLSMMNVDYDVYLSLSAEAEDYESEISLLDSQLDYLVEEFENLIKVYGGNFVVNGKTLSGYYNEIKTYADKDNLDTLLAKVKSDGILKSEESKQKYTAEQVNLQRRLTVAEATLNNLLSGTDGQGNLIYADAQVLKTQSDLVETLKQQIDDIDKYLGQGKYEGNGGTVNPEFGTSNIKPEYDKIKGHTDTLTNVVKVVYEKASSVAFISVNAVSKSGGMGMITSVVLCLVVGLIIACVAAYIVGIKRQKIKENAVEDNGEVNE